MEFFDNVKNIFKFVNNNRFSFDDVRTLTIEINDKSYLLLMKKHLLK
jgi:hypothetical protein